jgi:YD repeat-containing protein
MIQRFTQVNLALICFFSIIMSNALGQNDSDYPNSTVPLSAPTAASLGKYADVPVNYHTGIPSIGIDIHTIQEGPLKVPISLSYHAGGLKVQEQAGWVGAGWSLNINGVITRGSIRAMADESVTTEGNGDAIGYLASHGYYSYLYVNNLDDEEILDYMNFSKGRKDGEPDLFFFNFNGYSGKFYFREDGTPVVMPQQDVRIQPLIRDGFDIDKLYGWVATTPDGVKYSFGMTPNISDDTDAIEHTHPYGFSNGVVGSIGANGQTISKEISSWYLTKIESADGKFFIQYNYVPENYGFYTISMFPCTLPMALNRGFNLVKNRLYGVRLASVTFSNGSIQLVPQDTPREDLSDNLVPNDGENTNAKALKEIRIEGQDFCKSFEFTYSYLSSNEPLHGNYNDSGGVDVYNLHTDKKRLMLRSVKENLCDNEEAKYNYTLSKPPYIFSYYDEEAVPRTLSLGIDHWGFNNGAVDNTELIPSVSVNGGVYAGAGFGANRDSAWPAMRAGSLKSVQYPTGKKSEIVYGHHQAYVNHNWFTETRIYQGNARGSSTETATSEKINYPFPLGGVIKIRAKGFGGGSGTVHFGSFDNGSTTSVDEWIDRIYIVPPGTYEMYCSVSGQLGSGQGVMGEIWLLERHQQLETVVVGGLRTESITTTDGVSSTPLTTTLSYVSDNNIPQGVLYSRPAYATVLKNDRFIESGIAVGGLVGGGIDVGYSNGCQNVGGGENIKFAYELSPASVLPMQTTQGNHFGYNQVKVTAPGGGYTIYQYTSGNALSTENISGNIINERVCDPFAPNYPGAPEPIDYTRGELQRVLVFDDQDNRLKETQTVNEYQEEPFGIHGIIVRNNTGGLVWATEYELKNLKKTKSSTLEFNYSQSNPLHRVGLLNETFFESQNHTLPTRTVSTEVTGGDDLMSINTVVRGKVLNENRRVYVADITLPSCVPNLDYISTLNTALASAHTSYLSALSACSDATCRLYAWWNYTKTVNNHRITYVNGMLASHTLSATCQQAQPSTDLQALVDMKTQNQVAALVESSHWKDGKFIGSVYTTYKNYGINNDNKMIYPLKAEVYHTNKLLLPSAFQAFAYTDNTFAKDIHYALEESYVYQDGNLVEVTKKNGVPTAYLWGYNNTLPITKAVGVPFSVLLAANNAVNSDPEALRNHASLTKAFLTTYQFNPLTGMTAQTDANGVVTKYTYDDLGRLSFSRDQHDNIIQKIDYFYRNTRP